MVNLRYHLVSLVAVFLALAIGILMGSTVVEQGTVAFLEDRLDDVAGRVDQTQRENDRLAALAAAASAREEALDEEGPGRLTAGAATDVDVVLLASAGGADGAVATLRSDLASAGANLRATVWITPRAAGDDADGIVRDLGLAPGLVDDPAALGAAIGELVADAIRPDLVPDILVTDGDRATAALELFESLSAAGLVEVETNDPAGIAAAFVAGENPPVVVVAHARTSPVPVAPLMESLLDRLAIEGGGPGLVVSLDADGADDSSDQSASQDIVELVRADEVRATSWSTVDGGPTFTGRVAVVFAVADRAAQRPSAHYGTRSGASRLLPPPLAPSGP